MNYRAHIKVKFLSLNVVSCQTSGCLRFVGHTQKSTTSPRHVHCAYILLIVCSFKSYDLCTGKTLCNLSNHATCTSGRIVLTWLHTVFRILHMGNARVVKDITGPCMYLQEHGLSYGNTMRRRSRGWVVLRTCVVWSWIPQRTYVNVLVFSMRDMAYHVGICTCFLHRSGRQTLMSDGGSDMERIMGK